MQEVIEKIKEDVFSRGFKRNFEEMTNSNATTHQFDYRFCISNLSGMEKYYFVVCKLLAFKGMKIDDYKYKYYVYDEKGNRVTDPNILEKCKGSFLETLQDID